MRGVDGHGVFELGRHVLVEARPRGELEGWLVEGVLTAGVGVGV